MKTIFRIARTELKMLFYSPIAWLILIVFTVICGLTFFDKLQKFAEIATSQGFGKTASPTAQLFTRPASPYGIFFIIKNYLYMFVPLLTMGLISQELHSGTIKLLNSSPVSNRHIVFGKFVSMMAYGVLLMVVIFLMAVLTAAYTKNFDWPTIFSGLLGLYLLFMTYAAIGIFMSSMTGYQVVAAIATFAVFVVLNSVGGITKAPEWFREVAQWVSIRGKAEELLAGMISSQDVIYFVIITMSFLSLTVLRLTNKSKARAWGVRWGGYLSVVVVACAVGMVSSMPELIFFHDSTHTKRLTITPNSQEIVKQVKGKVEVVNYVNIVGRYFDKGLPSGRTNDKNHMWMKYLRFKPDIKQKYVYYWHESDDEEIVKKYPDMTWEERAQAVEALNDVRAKILGPEEIDARIDLSEEGYRFVREMRFPDGQRLMLRIFDDQYRNPLEKEITAAFKRVASGPVKVGFLTGHGERSIESKRETGYWKFASDRWFRQSLLNHGFDACNVSVAGGAPIPDDIKILVISDLREPLTPAEEAEIMRYVESGRNLLITAKPGRQHLINPLAETLGVRFMDGRLVNPPSENLGQNLVMAASTPQLKELSPVIAATLNTYPNGRVSMPGAVGIEHTGKGKFSFQSETYLESDPLGWSELQTHDFEESVATPDPESGEKVGTVAVGMGLSRRLPRTNTIQKVLVMGDADCFANGELKIGRLGYYRLNYTVLVEMFAWLSDYEYPIDVSRPAPQDRGIYMNNDGERMWRWIFVGGLPLLMLVGAVIIIVRRKSR